MPVKTAEVWEKGWITYIQTEDREAVHIVPNDDLKAHTENGCDCKPVDVTIIDIPIFVHQSYDGREAAHAADKIFEHKYKRDYNK